MDGIISQVEKLYLKLRLVMICRHINDIFNIDTLIFSGLKLRLPQSKICLQKQTIFLTFTATPNPIYLDA